MKKTPVIAVTLLIVLLAGLLILRQNSTSDSDINTNMDDSQKVQSSTPTPNNGAGLIIDSTKTYTVVLKTSEGDIAIELTADKTPITANNFVALSKKGFYDNTIFHRVIEGFMIQGGDPNGNGTGDPGYKFDDEPFEGEYTRGTVAMANSGPNTNGSQFFIMHKDTPLPKNYVIFGHVTSGLEVVDKIATAEVKPSFGGEVSTPVSPVKILSVDVQEQ